MAASRSPRQGSRVQLNGHRTGGAGQWGAEGPLPVPLCWDYSGTPEARPVQDPTSPTSTRFLQGTPCRRREPVGTEPTALGATGPEKPGHPSVSPPSRPLPRGRERELCFGGFCQQGDLPVDGRAQNGAGSECTPSSANLEGAPSAPPRPSELCASWAGRGLRLLFQHWKSTPQRHF